MAQSTSKTVLEGDASQLFQEFSKIINKAKQYEGGLAKTADKAKKLSKEERDLAREAKRVYDETRTPQERHIQKMEQLNRLVRKGTIAQQTYRRAVKQSQEQLRTAGQAGQKSFGAGALGQVKSLAMGFIGVSAAVALVVRGLRRVVEERKELAQLQAEASFSAGALSQLTGGDPEKTAELQAVGQAIFAAGGTKSQPEAMKAAFNLQSAGALEQHGFVSRLAAIAGDEGIVGLTGKAGKLQSAFGKEETGDYVDIFSKATGAAAPLPEVGVSEILKATTKAAGAAGAIGLSDEELFAAISRVSSVYEPDEASTAVSRMLDQLSIKRPELAGKGLVKIIETLEAEDMSQKKLNTLLQTRGVRAFRVLKDTDALQSTLATVEQAQRDKAIMGVTGGGEESALVLPYREQQKQEAQEKVARTREAGDQALWDAQQSRIRRFSRDQGMGELDIGFRQWQRDLKGWFFDPEDMGRDNLGRVPEAERAEWEAKWDKLDRAAERLENAAENLKESTQAAENLNGAAENLNQTTRRPPVVVNN